MAKPTKIAFNILRNIAVPVFNFLILSFGIKWYGKESWGELLNVLLWVYFLAFLINWGHRDYLVRTISKNPSKLFASLFSNFLSRTVFLLPVSLLLFVFFPPQTSCLSIALVFLMHVNTSFESLIIYRQKFSWQLLSELLGFAILGCLLFFTENFSVDIMLQFFIVSYAAKNLFLFLLNKIPLKSFTVTLSYRELIVMLPFFLIVFSGWIQSKVDLYIVNLFLSPERLSEYQLLNTSFLMLQGMSGFILLPVTKHLYRLSDVSIKKIHRQLALLSLPIVIAGTFSIWFLLNYILNLQIEFYIFILGGVSAFPVFLYLVNIMNLYKKNRENVVMKINFIGTALSLTISISLVPYYGYVGAFTAVVITQYCLLFIYKTKYAI